MRMTDKLQPIGGPTVWTGPQLIDHYATDATPEELEELDRLRTRLRATGSTLHTVSERDFDSQRLSRLADRLLAHINEGPGLVVLRQLPVAAWGDEDATLIYWGLGTRLGRPRPQNAAGDRVYLVTDTTSRRPSTPGEHPVRGSTSNEELIFHTDSASAYRQDRADILGLMCLRPAMRGGVSGVVSGHTVHNALASWSPELLARLYREFRFGRSASTYADRVTFDAGPVFSRYADRVDVRYNRYWIERGHQISGDPLDELGVAALDAFDQVLATPDIALEFTLRAGEVLFCDNNLVLHCRTAFEDFEHPRSRRCLVRLWLNSRPARPAASTGL